MALYTMYAVKRLNTAQFNKLGALTTSYIFSLKFNPLISRAQSFKVFSSDENSSLLSRMLFKSSVNAQLCFSEDIKVQTSAKRLQRRKISEEEVDNKKTPGTWHVSAYATSEEYNLEKLREGLIKQNLYKPTNTAVDPLTNGGADVIHAVANYQLSSELRHIYFFREGSVVFWNTPELECISVLDFLKQYQFGSYNRKLVLAEREIMTYSYASSNKRSILDNNKFCISSGAGVKELEINLDKFTLSNAMSLSVKLGIWEASLNKYIDSIEYVVEDLKNGKALRISRKEVTRKTGELFALRHSINLSSDLLDVPDFYWENDELENLYLQLCSYFSISRRTRVMNEKLNHCMELVELLTSHLSDRHHVRLEWMIIILIMIEVVIEVLHSRH
ncbi:required for meiotic nuclear division protein 1 homolog [Homalodisca vitripennis]|uniref:DUF155 domain-containing protein n=1 Tax=Homalodisca liturata TaxID=320908 RepID=A0A1B6J9S6_9HEMI|nr:required for meiotic nuclear division protein 1 homolog [Homalodisca vitripennis]XP_046686165.1 required for meiotic nuclear division protein 1 homolog [Homalodisca vitripennis]KAG8253086.1 hypothetical protein J6590_042895 [Homalodisca vitripennis]